MSKYDFEVDLSLNSSTGMILNKLRPDSVVLEFGCAAGRMTRYMKEQLNCSVYIVEYDPDAFEKAMQYALDGLCDDIQNDQWLERFASVRFDAIIFADVLEHLTQPQQVLEKASRLLKEDGCVYLSIPNVTHNDILLKAMAERFDYTQTGLLDDTHVHFWGLENLKMLTGIQGLHIRNLEATYCPTGSTEQAMPDRENLLLQNILRQRQAGEVYQFVITMDKRDDSPMECTICPPTATSQIYLDTGKDFNAEERIAIDAVYSGAGSYFVKHEIAAGEELCAVRLDPVERQSCVIRNISIRQAEEELPLIAPGAVYKEDGLFLPGTDPMVIAKVTPGKGAVTVTAEFVLPGEQYLRELEAWVLADQKAMEETRSHYQAETDELRQSVARLDAQSVQLQAHNDTLHTHNDQLHEQNERIHAHNQQLQEYNTQLQSNNDQLRTENECVHSHNQQLLLQNEQLHEENLQVSAQKKQLHSQNVMLNKQTAAQQKTICALEAENGQLRVDVGAYIELTNQKEKYAIMLIQQRDSLIQQRDSLIQQRDAYIALSENRANYIAQLEEGIRYYQNLKVVRLRMFAVRVLRGVWRRVKRVLGRG